MGEIRHLYEILIRTCDSKQPLGMPSQKQDVNLKLVLLFIKHQATRECGSSSRVAYLTLALCQFTSEETAQYSLNRKMRCPRIHLDALEKTEKHQESTTNVCHPTCSLVTVPTELRKYSGKAQSYVIWLSVGSNGRLVNMVTYHHIL